MSDSLPQDEAPEVPTVSIPPIFFSDLTGKAMETCVTCNKNLLHSKEPYIIEKAFRHYPEYDINNTIFEYIMCIPCAQKMNASMSKDSMEKIQDYFSTIDMVGRGKYMYETYGKDFNAWINNCIVKHVERGGLEEYQICAQCVGDQIVFNVFPYMISHEASSEITDLLSSETLGEYNRFVDDYFGLPPAFKKALKESPVLV